MMDRTKNIILKGSNGRPMALDLFAENEAGKSRLLYMRTDLMDLKIGVILI